MGMIRKPKWDGMEEERRMDELMADGLALSGLRCGEFPCLATAGFAARRTAGQPIGLIASFALWGSHVLHFVYQILSTIEMHIMHLYK